MTSEFIPASLVPAYQAAETVGGVVRAILRHVPRVLVVDDGSRDATGERAGEAGAEVLRLPENSGKGSAIRAGLERLLASDATHIAFLDADGQHDPDDLPALLEAARSGDAFVIGSRMTRPEEIPAVRYRTNEIGSRILTRMTGHEVEDGQSGYRVIAAELLRRLELHSRGYMIETEILLKAARRVARFRHVPVRAIYGGPSHYRPFRDTWIISWGAVYYKVFETD
ncbi:MAG TPA: glycosyltransferase family 2 protein [Thermoanaerobaculia bacterium]|nr:glycosyltransferase family 2 protein [Thermoanaerobaculia bacterium]